MTSALQQSLLAVLADPPYGGAHLRWLARKVGATRAAVRAALESLARDDLVERVGSFFWPKP